jgi:hypothetical protein
MSTAAGFGMVFYFQNSAAFTNGAITYTKQTSGRAATIAAFYVTGAATASALDSAFTNTSAVNSASPTVTSAAAPASIGELIVGACTYSSGAARTLTNTGSFVPPFTNVGTQVGAQVGGGHINVGGNLSYTFNPTIAAASDNITFILAFKPPSAQLKGWWNITPWAASTVTAAGAFVRQNATPTIGSERVFVCTVAGTTGGSEPSWVVTRGAKTTDNTVTWMEMTGVAGLNGDTSTNTPNWTVAKANNASPSLGCLIQRTNGASYWVCTTAGAMGAGEPSWLNDTAGTTQADNTVTWTCLGVVGNWTGWLTPCPRINILTATGWVSNNSISGKSDIYVASEHAEAQATAYGFSLPLGKLAGTALVGRVLCVTKSTVPPVSANLTTGASITVTGNNSITGPGGNYYMQGLSISAGSGATFATFVLGPTSGVSAYYKNCALVRAGTLSTQIVLGVQSSVAILDNTTVQFGVAADSIRIDNNSRVMWRNTTGVIAGSIIPTTLLASTINGELTMEALDLSAITGTLLNMAGSLSGRIVLRNCKLNAGVAIGSASVTEAAQPILDLIRCDSGATNYRHERWRFEGTQTVETTIVRTGGATDGTTPISWKIVTNANSLWNYPYEAMPMAIWNDTTATNRVVTVYGITAAGGLPNTDDVWIEVEYPGSASSPLATIATTTKADTLAAGVAVASDGSTWGGGVTAFKLTTTLSTPQPQMKGPFLIVVKVAKPSTTFYIDPAAVLS